MSYKYLAAKGNQPGLNGLVSRTNVLRQALESGLSGAQARVLTAMLARADRAGVLCRSQDDIGLDAAVSRAGKPIKGLEAVEVIRKGDWLTLRATTYRLAPDTAPDDTLVALAQRFSHDAFRQGSPLSAASPLVAWLAITDGPWRLADLRATLKVPESTMRAWTTSLAAAGLIERGHGKIGSLTPIEDWQPLLDAVATEYGTAGAKAEHKARIARQRAQAEPMRQKLLMAKRETAKRLEATRRSFEAFGLLDKFTKAPGDLDHVRRRLFCGTQEGYVRRLSDITNSDRPWLDKVRHGARLLASVRVTPWLSAHERYQIENEYERAFAFDSDRWSHQAGMEALAKAEGTAAPLLDPLRYAPTSPDGTYLDPKHHLTERGLIPA